RSRAMTARRVPLLVACALAALVSSMSPALGKDDKKKPGPPAGPPRTGTFRLDAKAPTSYILMSVPKDYDPKRWYPLVFALHAMTDTPASNVPEPMMDAVAPDLVKRGWIVAAPKSLEYNTDFTPDALKAALAQVLAAYHIDDRRVVLVG